MSSHPTLLDTPAFMGFSRNADSSVASAVDAALADLLHHDAHFDMIGHAPDTLE